MSRRALRVIALAIVITATASGCEDPIVPDDVHDFVDVAVGSEHSCAVTTEGEVLCWGRGTDGQLGADGVTDEFTPRKVRSEVAFEAVTAGAAHTCALGRDGRAHCWGFNAFYQTGAAFALNLRIPGPIDGAARFSSISAGSYHTCGIALDDRVFCWGHNRWGQNGNGLTQTTIPAEPTAGDLEARMISAGGFHTCAVSTTGVAYCWGSNEFGQLGIGSDTLFSAIPVPVRTSLRFTEIDAGQTHTCAISTDRRAFCWGSAGHGEIGDGAAFRPDLPGHASPVPVRLLSSVSVVSAGANQACAVDGAAGTLCWGRGTEGQLGNGDARTFSSPQPVKPARRLTFSDLAAGGISHACGIAGGVVYCWGSGAFGQLGTGAARTMSNLPERIGR